jgi:DNA-binding LacI/PurR family transcriptional regulator
MIDVATRAGVSPATVSLVLAGKGRISESTRTRVLDAVRSLDYTVNRSARSLRTAKTGALGLYLPEYAGTLEFYMSLAFGAVEAADRDGSSVVLVAPHLRGTSIATLPVDGFIVVDVDPDDAVVRAIIDGPKPVVVGEAAPPSLPAPAAAVEFDHVAAMRTLLDHLWERGARRIGAITVDINLQWAHEVTRGYDEWAREKGMPSIRRGVTAETGPSGVHVVTTELLTDGIDALVTVPDTMTPTVVRNATEAGRRIGDDLLVASYFDGSFAEWMTPTITALDFNPRNFGRILVRTLNDVLAGVELADTTITIPPSDVQLRIRDSSGSSTRNNHVKEAR